MKYLNPLPFRLYSGGPSRPPQHLISLRRNQSSFKMADLGRFYYFASYFAVGQQVVVNSIEWVWLPDEGRRFGERMTMRFVFEHHTPWVRNGVEYDVRHEFSATVTEVQSFPSIPWDPLASSLQTASPASSSPTASSSRSAWS